MLLMLSSTKRVSSGQSKMLENTKFLILDIFSRKWTDDIKRTASLHKSIKTALFIIARLVSINYRLHSVAGLPDRSLFKLINSIYSNETYPTQKYITVDPTSVTLRKVSSHINAQIVETRRFISNDISYGFDYSFGGIIKFYRSKEMYAFPYADTRLPLTFHPYFRPISILYFPCTLYSCSRILYGCRCWNNELSMRVFRYEQIREKFISARV